MDDSRTVAFNDRGTDIRRARLQRAFRQAAGQQEDFVPGSYGPIVSRKQPQSRPEVATISHSPADRKWKPLG